MFFLCFYSKINVFIIYGQLYTATSRVIIDHVRHRKPRRFVYALNLGGTGINPRTKALPDKNPPGQKCPRAKDPRGKSAQRRHILLQR